MKHRKPRPLKSKKGEYLRLMDYRILELDNIIDDIQREKRRYLKSCDALHGPAGMSNSNYSEERVAGGQLRMSFADVIQRLHVIQNNLCKCVEERQELLKKRARLVELYKRGEGAEAMIFYYREVMQYSQQMTAEKVGYSVRQVRRIEGRLKVL